MTKSLTTTAFIAGVMALAALGTAPAGDLLEVRPNFDAGDDVVGLHRIVLHGRPGLDGARTELA